METHTPKHRISTELHRRRNRRVLVNDELHHFRVNLPSGVEPWWVNDGSDTLSAALTR